MSEERDHELAADCWCGPRVDHVAMAEGRVMDAPECLCGHHFGDHYDNAGCVEGLCTCHRTPNEALITAAVARAIESADAEWSRRASGIDYVDGRPVSPIPDWNEYLTAAVLSVPVVRDALARDAKVAEIIGRGAVGGWGPLAVTACLSDLGDIAALYSDATS